MKDIELSDELFRLGGLLLLLLILICDVDDLSTEDDSKFSELTRRIDV